MKCQQCGTELDRLTKWRGPSEYCSDKCRKASQDEINQLVMGRLMQPRPARSLAKAGVSVVRTVESGSGRLTVVTHPVGASSPILTEPPEAGFIMEAASTMADLQLRHQPPVTPRPMRPFIPVSAIPVGDALLSLEALLSGIRRQPRPARRLYPASKDGLARLQPSAPDIELTAGETVSFASLGFTLNIAGIESWTTAPVAGAPANLFAVDGFVATPVVSHGTIPGRRGARTHRFPLAFEVGKERLIQPPVVLPPRLRIHLPRPALHPFRPRYAFAPAPAEAKLLPEPAVQAVLSEPEVGTVPEPAWMETVIDAGDRNRPQDYEERIAKESGKNGLAVDAFSERKSPAGPAAPEAADGSVAIPSFAGKFYCEPEGFFSRLAGWRKVAAAAAVLVVAVGAWAIPAINRHNARLMNLPAPAAPAPSYIGAGSWETVSAADTAGIARGRVISVYRPARTKRDYVFEFTGQIEQHAMGWVFRMKDGRNYYCLKLEKQGEGAAAKARLVKLAVVDGEEQSHGVVELREAVPPDLPVTIRIDVRGHVFSTQVNGKQVDVWIDNKLASGSVGFCNESGERAAIRTVKVSY